MESIIRTLNQIEKFVALNEENAIKLNENNKNRLKINIQVYLFKYKALNLLSKKEINEIKENRIKFLDNEHNYIINQSMHYKTIIDKLIHELNKMSEIYFKNVINVDYINEIAINRQKINIDMLQFDMLLRDYIRTYFCDTNIDEETNNKYYTLKEIYVIDIYKYIPLIQSTNV